MNLLQKVLSCAAGSARGICEVCVTCVTCLGASSQKVCPPEW